MSSVTCVTLLNICVLVIFRILTGKFKSFLTQLVMILQSLYASLLNLVICGDVNVNYLNDNDKRNQLDAVLNS